MRRFLPSLGRRNEGPSGGARRSRAWRTLAALGLGLLTLALPGCYVWRQGWGQAELLWRREPVATLLARPETPVEWRRKLQFVAQVKQFAQRELGLAGTHHFESFVALDRDAVTYVVSAAPKDSLDAYQWWFPVVGQVPYKGYFRKQDALDEQARMDGAGYDTSVRGVAAFSLLGWLPDPIYSPLLARDEPTLADIVIHETTHATVYLAGRSSFNEGFATFVGNQGALAYFASLGPGGREAWLAARAAQADTRTFTAFVEEVSQRLEALYASSIPRDEKLRQREAVFAWAQARFRQSYAVKMQGHGFRHVSAGRFNNAVLSAYRTYYRRLDRFERAHTRCGGDLRRTIAFFRDQVAQAPDPEGFLERWIAP
ncbi:MAG: aminopeptidase [Candidatus Sericytochromatia bacterium]|nr:aminopeptidase [Candidatus Sericytochromatia bacterium]